MNIQEDMDTEKRNRRCKKGLQETCRSKDENTQNIPNRIFKMSDAVEEKKSLDGKLKSQR